MSELLSTVIPLSIGAAFSPTVLAITVVLLGGKRNPRARVFFMIVGMVVVLAGLALLASSATHQIEHTDVNPLLYWLDIGLGLFLLILGLRKLLGGSNRDETKPRFARRGKADAGPWRFIPIGFVVMITDISSIVLFIPAIRDIAAASVSTADKYLVSILPFMAVLAPAYIPLLAAIISPKKAGRAMQAVNSWLAGHSRVIGVSLSFIFGVFLIWRGVSNLF